MRETVRFVVVVLLVVVVSLCINVGIVKFVGGYVVNNVLNECASCGALTLDRYPTISDNGTKVYVCPHCDNAARE
jgi:DNA-directed RNA polymerase subunit RPC12/RpoP